MYRVQDVMTHHLVTVKPTDELALADSILSLEHFRHLPVVSDDGGLVGLVTHAEVWRALARLGGSARTLPVSEVMVRSPLTASTDMPASEAATVMLENKLGCLPVVRRGTLVGVVTEADFLRLAADLCDHAAPPKRTVAAEGAPRRGR